MYFCSKCMIYLPVKFEKKSWCAIFMGLDNHKNKEI